MNGKISIIIPVYNAENSLDRCIESILHQTYSHFEILLIDDGSNDSSGEICNDYASRYDNVKCIHKSNGGVSSARNCGLEISSGSYVTFIDSDDYVAPDYLQGLMNCTKNPLVQLVQGSFCKICNDDITRCELIKCVDSELVTSLRSDYFKYLRGFICSKLFYNGIIKQHNIKFDESITIAEDLCFVLEYIRYVKAIAFIPTDGYYYCVNLSSASYKFHHPDAMLAEWTKEASLLEYLKPAKEEPQDSFYRWKSSIGDSIFSWLVNWAIINTKIPLKFGIYNVLRTYYKDYADIIKIYSSKSKLKTHIIKSIYNRRFIYAALWIFVISLIKHK